LRAVSVFQPDATPLPASEISACHAAMQRGQVYLSDPGGLSGGVRVSQRGQQMC